VNLCLCDNMATRKQFAGSTVGKMHPPISELCVGLYNMSVLCHIVTVHRMLHVGKGLTEYFSYVRIVHN
jgi:hypothetical protein